MDPDGRDWYSYQKDIYDKNGRQSSITEYAWTTLSSQDELNAAGVTGTYLGKAVVVFDGSRNERLGTKTGDHVGLYIDGEGAITAKVTVYGPHGVDDVRTYNGFTMTSNYEKFGAIAEGIYNVNYDVPGKSGNLKSNYAINNGGPVDCVDGVNPSPIDPFSPTQKNAVYIHATNRNGKAGGNVNISTGCLLIQGGSQWENFQLQLGKVDFKLILNRRK